MIYFSSYIAIAPSFFVKLLFTSSTLQLISCFSNSNDTFDSSFNEDLQLYLNSSSNNLKLSELHFISCSNLFLFNFQSTHFYKLLSFLLNNFEDLKILNLKNSILFFKSFNLFSQIRNNNNGTNNYNNDKKDKIKEFFNELYSICLQFNERNIIKCFQINGIHQIQTNENYFEKFEELNNLTVIFNLDDNLLV